MLCCHCDREVGGGVTIKRWLTDGLVGAQDATPGLVAND
jgi:hypothetical protein